MSVLDDFRDAEQRVAQRLKELAPAVAEYRQLEDVARRLGLDVTPDAEATGSPPIRRRSPKAGRSAVSTVGKRRARPGVKRSARPAPTDASSRGRAEQLLALVRERPGITVAEAGKEFGVDPTSLYRVVHRLEQRGQLSKNGRNLEPVAPTS